ncbi:unnamed protein product [Protopolystoma xenopodis]|uniref:Uncharacterized protein n=1 Tax=Protopolystoma xenopodis TaxID=117903 RepID=A0A448WZD2_9PLAT|nr:unnamed protein product [Protopolystoma xenopodis]
MTTTKVVILDHAIPWIRWPHWSPRISCLISSIPSPTHTPSGFPIALYRSAGAAEKSMRHGAQDRAQAAIGTMRALMQHRLNERPELFTFIADVFQVGVSSRQHLESLESVQKSILAGTSQWSAKVTITGSTRLVPLTITSSSASWTVECGQALSGPRHLEADEASEYAPWQPLYAESNVHAVASGDVSPP